MAKKLTKLNKKAQAALKSNIFSAIALTSILLNLFFLTGWVMYASTNNLDRSLHSQVRYQYCEENYAANRAEIVEESGVAAAKLYDFECGHGEAGKQYQRAAVEAVYGEYDEEESTD